MNHLIAQLMTPLQRSIDNLVARALVRLVDDGKKLQELQLEIFEDDVRSGCPRIQNYGFTAHPKPGAEAVILHMQGDRASPLVIAVDDRRYRLVGLAEGEVALYTDEGDHVWLKRGRNIEVKAGTKVTIDAPDAEFTGNLKVTQKLTVDGSGGIEATAGDVKAQSVSLHNHAHSGVQTGAGISGAPVP